MMPSMPLATSPGSVDLLSTFSYRPVHNRNLDASALRLLHTVFLLAKSTEDKVGT
jgi:hypothetical protein